MIFEWDEAKERANIAKHELDFETATKAFPDPLLVEVLDEANDDEEPWNALGVVNGRILFVTYFVTYYRAG